jgi:redox-sensing transcriptional repressor
MHIPQTAIYRLSLYLRELERLDKEGQESISSKELGWRNGISDAQIRKDLNYFGKFGKSKTGYNVMDLKDNIRRILGIDRVWNAALVGAGNLGAALISYRGFRERGFIIKAVFDNNPKKIGRLLGNLKINNLKDIIPICRKEKIDIGIITVPASIAGEIAHLLVKAGVKSILNFAPTRIILPVSIKLKNVDLSIELENISFYLTHK